MTNLATSYKPAAAVSDSFIVFDGYILTSVLLNPVPEYFGYSTVSFLGGSISPSAYQGFTISELFSGNGPPFQNS